MCRYTAPSVLAFRRHLVMWHQERLVVSHRGGYSEVFLPLSPEVAARRRSRLQNRQGSRSSARQSRIQDHLSPPFNEDTTNYIPAGYGSPRSLSSWSSGGLTNDTEFSDEFDRHSCFSVSLLLPDLSSIEPSEQPPLSHNEQEQYIPPPPPLYETVQIPAARSPESTMAQRHTPPPPFPVQSLPPPLVPTIQH